MQHILPPLPYDPSALEPHIDARTMVLHHDKHHASYVKNLNSALEPFPELHERNAMWLLLNLRSVPRKIRAAVRNNAGGHVNHSLLWRSMSADAGSAPTGPLADAIEHDFGGLQACKDQFAAAGAGLFGSGWVWLARSNQDGRRLQVCTTTGHDNPLMRGRFPILVNDVWEHAYYLKHQNRRPDYLRGWWQVANWEDAVRRFELSDESAARSWEIKDAPVFAPTP